MSEQREALMEVCWAAIGGRSLDTAPRAARDDMSATADALLAAGYCLVPAEPTPELMQVWRNAHGKFAGADEAALSAVLGHLRQAGA